MSESPQLTRYGEEEQQLSHSTGEGSGPFSQDPNLRTTDEGRNLEEPVNLDLFFSLLLSHNRPGQQTHYLRLVPTHRSMI